MPLEKSPGSAGMMGKDRGTLFQTCSEGLESGEAMASNWLSGLATLKTDARRSRNRKGEHRWRRNSKFGGGKVSYGEWSRAIIPLAKFRVSVSHHVVFSAFF